MFGQLAGRAIHAAENGRLPDKMIRMGIRRLLRQRLAELNESSVEERADRLRQFIKDCRDSPVAVVPERANEQHYEVPAAFFRTVLGDRLKYSCCYWTDGVESLNTAEDAALEITCERAELEDGMNILELGCGWGSLTLWMAERYPNSRIMAVSNSSSQRTYVNQRAAELGLTNIEIVTADMNDFSTERTFDRVVSIEMFEHMRNHEELLRRISQWLCPTGRLFVHLFCHRQDAYLFETDGQHNWMGRHFFTGGMMPSDGLLLNYQRDLNLVDQWRWGGRHYQRTCNAWLERLDQNFKSLHALLAETYGSDQAVRCLQRWRIFFLACAELFDYRHGREWWVSHYLFEK